MRINLNHALLTATAVLAALAVTACGSSGPGTTSVGNSGNSGSGNLSTAAAAKVRNAGIVYAKCMRAHGVPNFPDPGSNGGVQISSSNNGSGQQVSVNGVQVSAPAFQSASQKCQKNMPKGPPLTASQIDRLRAGALAMAKCMRAHGVTNFPDPTISTGPGGHGVGIKIGGPNLGMNPSSPVFQAAAKTCGGPLGFRAKVVGTGKGS